jgi:type IV secretion system protein VirD4
VTQAVGSIALGDSLEGEVSQEQAGTDSYELLSEEDLEAIVSAAESH